jgi:hypothetical protein
LGSRAKEELESAATDSDGLIAPAQGRTLDVRTSKGSVRRVLLMLDALLKECERRGFQVSPGPSITIDGHKITLGVSEGVETTREEAGRFKTMRVLTGRLTLAVTDGRGYWASGSRSTWRDTEKARLDDRLGKVLLGLIEIAELAKRHELEQQRRREEERLAEARRQEAARQLAERRKQYQAEKARFPSAQKARTAMSSGRGNAEGWIALPRCPSRERVPQWQWPCCGSRPLPVPR